MMKYSILKFTVLSLFTLYASACDTYGSGEYTFVELSEEDKSAPVSRIALQSMMAREMNPLGYIDHKTPDELEQREQKRSHTIGGNQANESALNIFITNHNMSTETQRMTDEIAKAFGQLGYVLYYGLSFSMLSLQSATFLKGHFNSIPSGTRPADIKNLEEAFKLLSSANILEDRIPVSKSNQANGMCALKLAASTGDVDSIYFLACIHMSTGYAKNVEESKKLLSLIYQKDPRARDAVAIFHDIGNPIYTGPRIFPR